MYGSLCGFQTSNRTNSYQFIEKIDKYGRKASKSAGKGDLLRLYRLKDEEEAAAASTGPDLARGEGLLESSDEEEEEETDLPQRLDSPVDSSDDDEAPVTLGRESTSKLKKKTDTLSDDDDIDDDAIPEIDLDETNFEDLDAQAKAWTSKYGRKEPKPLTGKETSRVAVVNLDWDHVQASQLFKIFDSTFASKSGSSRGRVLNVSIYPSSFGKERMAREEIEGPPADLFQTAPTVADEDMDEEDVNEETIFQQGDDSKFNNDALRKYQLERLR